MLVPVDVGQLALSILGRLMMCWSLFGPLIRLRQPGSRRYRPLPSTGNREVREMPTLSACAPIVPTGRSASRDRHPVVVQVVGGDFFSRSS